MGLGYRKKAAEGDILAAVVGHTAAVVEDILGFAETGIVVEIDSEVVADPRAKNWLVSSLAASTS